MKALVGALALLFLVPPAAAAAAGEEQPVAVAAARTAVVEAGQNRGAGFAVDEDRLLTAAHVVAGHDTVTVVTGGQNRTAKVVRVDKVTDLAEVQVAGGGLQPLALAAEAPSVGTEVFAIGVPTGDLTVTRGIVSARPRVGGIDHLQTDAAINPGNSGGPLVTDNGEVVGLVVSKVATAEGIGLALPAEVLHRFLDGEPQLGTGPDGRPAPVRHPSGIRPLVWLSLALPVLGIGLLVRTRPRSVRIRFH
jgi:S1-C subfamily serine protease